jgi:hypothetical protein
MSYQQSRTRNVHFLAARLMGDGRKLPLANIFRIAYYLSFPNWLGLIFTTLSLLLFTLSVTKLFLIGFNFVYSYLSGISTFFGMTLLVYNLVAVSE